MSTATQTPVQAPTPTEKPATPAPVAVRSTDAAIAVKDHGVELRSLADLFRFSQWVVEGGWAPKGMGPTAVVVAIQAGYEIGLPPMQACQSIAVINGRPSIFGDAAKALVEASGLMLQYRQWYELAGKRLTTAEGHTRNPTQEELARDDLICCVLVQRKNREPEVTTFSVGDAKKAQLWGKQGPWQQYPARMLLFRARGFALRDAFSDVLKGLYTAEEAQDLPPATAVQRLADRVLATVGEPGPVHNGVTHEADPEPAPADQVPEASVVPPPTTTEAPPPPSPLTGEGKTPPPRKDQQQFTALLDTYAGFGGDVGEWLVRAGYADEGQALGASKATLSKLISQLDKDVADVRAARAGKGGLPGMAGQETVDAING